MAVRLRLMRMGRKRQPFYRIVAVDSRKKRDGVYKEKIGYYNPLSRPAEVVIDDDKALKWLNRGAIPTDTVRSLFSRRGVMLAFDLQKRGLKEEEIRERVARFRLEKEAKLRERESPVQKAAKEAESAQAAPPDETETIPDTAEENASSEKAETSPDEDEKPAPEGETAKQISSEKEQSE